MTLDVITKLQAADRLLDVAVEMLVDREDYVSAIVLAGAAEDVLQGLIKKQGRGSEAARAQMLPHIIAFAQAIDPAAPRISDAVGYSLLRTSYNWLRHHDRDDPESLEIDLRVEAIVTVERAIENRHALDRTEHPRVREVVGMGREALGN